MITERGDVFWYRSAYLWLQRYTNFPMFFEVPLPTLHVSW